jgi:transcriptional regulator with XRE-family HTH domain
MTADTESAKSYWWSLLSEFGEEVLLDHRTRLGLTQADMARRCGVVQSEISRIERGLATPQNVPVFNILCGQYKLDDEEKSKFAELVTGTKNPQSLDTSTNISRLLRDQISFVANLNRSGNPKMAIKQSEIIREWLDGKSVKNSIANSQTIIKQLTLLILEESAAWWDVVDDKSTLVTKTGSLLKKSFALAPDGNFHLTNEAFHAYILGDYNRAENFLPRIKNIKTNDGHNWGIELLRIKTIISSNKYYCVFLLCFGAMSPTCSSPKESFGPEQMPMLFTCLPAGKQSSPEGTPLGEGFLSGDILLSMNIIICNTIF